MDSQLLHTMCKEYTRAAFKEFKRIIDINLFPLTASYKKDLQNNLLQGLCSRATKHFVMNGNLSEQQVQYLTATIEQYKQIVLKTSYNYFKR